MVSRKYLSERCHCRISVCSDLTVTDALIRDAAVHEKDRNACVPRSLSVRFYALTCNIIADDSAGFVCDSFPEGFRLFFRHAIMRFYNDIVSCPPCSFKDYVLHLCRQTCLRWNDQIYDRYIPLLRGSED